MQSDHISIHIIPMLTLSTWISHFHCIVGRFLSKVGSLLVEAIILELLECQQYDSLLVQSISPLNNINT
jgi:hypothetical protein